MAAINYYKALIEHSALVDSMPKNEGKSMINNLKGNEYKKLCMQLAEGYEMDWIVPHYILCNEFGKPEHIDAFKRRHPNFAEDIRKAMQET